MSAEQYRKFLVKQNGAYLKELPPSKQTEELCIYAIECNAHNLLYVHKRTERLNILAVSKDYTILTNLKKEERTDAVVWAALHNNCRAIYHLTEITPDMLIFAHACGVSASYLLGTKKVRQTYELCLTAVSLSGWALPHVNASFRTREMCMAAVLQNPEVITYITDPVIRSEIEMLLI